MGLNLSLSPSSAIPTVFGVRLASAARFSLESGSLNRKGGPFFVALLSGCHSGQVTQTGTPLVKVCGITAPAEIDVLRANRVDFVGLWWGVPGGPHDLDRERWAALAHAAAGDRRLAPGARDVRQGPRGASRHARDGARAMDPAARLSDARAVRKVKAIGDDVRVIKVLHVRGGRMRRGIADRLLREGRRRRVPVRRRSPRTGASAARARRSIPPWWPRWSTG